MKKKKKTCRWFRSAGLALCKKCRTENFSHVSDFQKTVILNPHSLNVSMTK